MVKIESQFKREYSFEKRKSESERIRKKYPERIPVIADVVDTNLQQLDKHKYLIPADLTVGQMLYVFRKRIKLTHEKALFMFINNILPPSAELMSKLYEDYKDEDNFLYVTLRSENSFG